jgi:hypothetical protein
MSATTIDEKLLTKIRGLLALANHTPTMGQKGTTEEEMSAAADAAQRLLLKHGLAMADVLAGLGGGEDKPEATHIVLDMGVSRGASCDWCMDLATAVARACFCQALFYHKERRVVFVGEATFVATARELYYFLFDQCARLCLNACYTNLVEHPAGHNKTVKLHGFEVTVSKYWHAANNRKIEVGGETNAYDFCRSFLIGIGRRVSERLHEQTRLARAAEEVTKVTALVRVTEGLIQAHIAATWKIGKPVRRGVGAADDRGLRAGYRAGDQVELQKKGELEENITSALPPYKE